MESSLMFFIALSLAVIGNVLIPFVNYVLLAVFVSTVGFQMGILDTGLLIFHIFVCLSSILNVSI